MNKIYIITLFSFILFTGCSSKTQAIQPKNTTIKEQTVKPTQDDINTTDESFNEDDDMLDEFNDELETTTKDETKSDPLKPYNIFMTNFNDKLYKNVLRPVAKGYKKITNKPVRDGVSNFFSNLMYPINFINNILQLKFKNAAIETERFVINTTVGLLGFFDVAKNQFGLKPHKEDFGQTLGYWGVGSGPHIVLPFFGPSNLRDMFSMYPDSLADPVVYNSNRDYNLVDNTEDGIALKLYDKVNYTAQHLGEYESFTKGSLSLYELLKNAYEQRRIQQIKE